MNAERQKKYNAMIDRINAMSVEEQDALVAADQCPFESEHLIGVPMGMDHCPLCGEMYVAGFTHPRQNIDYTEVGGPDLKKKV
jgi:hypothetical protein